MATKNIHALNVKVFMMMPVYDKHKNKELKPTPLIDLFLYETNIFQVEDIS